MQPSKEIKATIEPVIVQEMVFPPEATKAVASALIALPTGAVVRAVVVDSYMAESKTIIPELGINLLLESQGEFMMGNAADHMDTPEIAGMVASIMRNTSELIPTLEWLTDQLPLFAPGRHIRILHAGDLSVICMEYLEGVIEECSNGSFSLLETQTRRAQMATVVLPPAASAHQKIQHLAAARPRWENLKGAWPKLIGQQYGNTVRIADPDMSTYPAPLM